MADLTELLKEVMDWMEFVEQCRKRDEKPVYRIKYSDDTTTN